MQNLVMQKREARIVYLNCPQRKKVNYDCWPCKITDSKPTIKGFYKSFEKNIVLLNSNQVLP